MAKSKINLSFLKNKNVIGAACIIIGIVFGFVLIPIATGLSGTEVIRAKVPIPEGTQIRQNMVEQVRMGTLNLPADTIHNLKDVVGKYADADFAQKDNLTKSKVSGSNPNALQPGQMEMSVAIKNFAGGVSGKLQAGDIVSVFCPQSVAAAVNGGSTVQPAIYPQELQYVRVAAVTASTGKDTDPSNYQNTSSTSTNTSNTLPASVTLIVNAKQASILAGMDNLNVHLALVCKGNDSQSKALLQQQTEALSLEPVTSAGTTSQTSTVSPATSGATK